MNSNGLHPDPLGVDFASVFRSSFEQPWIGVLQGNCEKMVGKKPDNLGNYQYHIKRTKPPELIMCRFKI